MPIRIAERRRFSRSPRSERVEVSFGDPTLVTVEAELAETSATGFRIVHQSQALISGLEISLHRDKDTRRARVVWTHVLEGRRVSGCLLM